MATVLGMTGGEVVTPLMLVLSGLAVAVLVVLLRITPQAAVVAHTVDGVRTAIPRAAWLLGVMALGFGLSEGTAVDWSSLHVTDVAQVDTDTGSLGLVAVSGFMVLIRLLGDRLVTRFGRRAVVRFGGVIAALGYFTVTLVDSLPLLVVGWALVGFGVGMIAPQVYAVAGHLGGGRVLAVVVTFGYAAFLIGPAMVGFLVSQLGIQHAMVVPALLCAGIVALAATMPKQRRRPRSPPGRSAAMASPVPRLRRVIADGRERSRTGRGRPPRRSLAAGAARTGRRPDGGAVPDHPAGPSSGPARGPARSPPTAWRPGSSTCWRPSAAPGRPSRLVSRAAGQARPWSPRAP